MRAFAPALFLPLLAGVCAIVSNFFAAPRRNLAWFGRPAEMVLVAQPIATPRPGSILPTEQSETPVGRGNQKSTVVPPERLAASPVPEQPKTANGPYREISGDEAVKYFQDGALFLDARTSDDYEAAHVAGAWSLPVWESDLDLRLATFEAQSGAESKTALILYCTGGECRDSHMLASKLMSLGYRNLLIYREGFHDWSAHGRSTRKGASR
jgi:rhodanese-related sulfurtransferase